MSRRNITKIKWIDGSETESTVDRQLVLESDFDGVSDSHVILVLDADDNELERLNSGDAEVVTWA